MLLFLETKDIYLGVNTNVYLAIYQQEAYAYIETQGTTPQPRVIQWQQPDILPPYLNI